MSSTYFPVRYSQLDPHALKSELIKRYGLEEQLSCRVFDYGLNDIYQVKSQNEIYYLRISLAGVHERRDYEEEAYIIETLSKNNIRVASPIPCNDGHYIWEIIAPEGKRYAVLFEEAKQSPADDEIKKSYNLGRMLAQLHTVADENNFTVSRDPIDLVQLAEKPLIMIYPYLKHRQADYDFLNHAAEKLSNYVKENLSLEKPYYGYCHGDIHRGNVYFNDVEPTIFDFDCMGYGWRAHDICIYAWDITSDDDNYIEKEPWKAFLEGYNSIRKLSEIENTSINVFAALHELWLMGLHADVMERNAGCYWYDDKYFDYRIRLFKLWYNRCINL